MDKENVIKWLRLTACFGCGSNRVWEFLKSFESAEEAYSLPDDRAMQSKHLTAQEIKNAAKATVGQAEELIEYCEKRNIYIMTYDDSLYPEQLRSIYNPPAVLFCRGDLSCLKNEFCLSVVGTRRPSDYSVRFTAALTKELVKFGINIISGFAVGIDITASLSAVRNGGKTVVVLGNGLDHDYPKENVKYRSEIEKNGLFISEYYPKTSGTRFSFPTRNRILSGLSLGTIVVEAAAKSGALITANLALNQGKDIFAVAPHDLFDRRYGGNVSLIRDGAVCLCGVMDVLYEYYENYGHKIANAAEDMFARLKSEKDYSYSAAESENKPKAKKINKPVSDIQSADDFDNESAKYNGETTTDIDEASLTEDEALIYRTLKNAGKPMLADELSEVCGIDISDMLMLLTEMETDGIIKFAAGQSYTIC